MVSNDLISSLPESWFSVTPEKVASFTAERCKCDIIVDAFCGVGGNSIQFAKTCKRGKFIHFLELKLALKTDNTSKNFTGMQKTEKLC
jgi:trimethylguanosine synthase